MLSESEVFVAAVVALAVCYPPTLVFLAQVLLIKVALSMGVKGRQS
jgi:hypothetical protein